MVEFCCTIPALKSYKGAPQITAWDASHLANVVRGWEGDDLRLIINKLGELSAQAQQLRAPITNFDRILLGSHKLYLLTSGVDGKPGCVLAKGILKVGHKNLFIRKDSGHLVEMAPLCVLDFYVHESCQRQGLGHQLFEYMLEQENKRACQLGYDRPSSKLLSFLAKHYNLSNYISQTNQFVVYNDYFEDAEQDAQREKENCQKNVNNAPHIDAGSRKEKVLHGRRAAFQADDEEEQYSFTRLDSHRFASADSSRPNLSVVDAMQQPSYHRGRRNSHWASKQNHKGKSQSAPSNSPNHLDTLNSHRSSPGKGGQGSSHGQESQDQGNILKARRRLNAQTGESRKWHEHHETLVPCNNLHSYDEEPVHRAPAYSIVDEAERVKIQSLCSPSMAQKMDLIQTERAQIFGSHDSKHVKPPASSRQAAQQIHKSSQREPPLSYPFWTEAKELSGSHLHEYTPLDHRKSKACYQTRAGGHSPASALEFHRIII